MKNRREFRDNKRERERKAHLAEIQPALDLFWSVNAQRKRLGYSNGWVRGHEAVHARFGEKMARLVHAELTRGMQA